GTAWLERPGGSGPLDELVLDRLALAVAAIVERSGPTRTVTADPALVELAITGDSDDASRSRALRLMGFDAELPVRAVAVRSPLPLHEVARLACPTGPVKAALLGDVGVILATAVDRGALSVDVRAGVGAAGPPERSWREARVALRFASARAPVVGYEDLGALALLAQVPRDVAEANADVAAVARLASNPDLVETLEAYCATGSLRQAADRLHLHHSSVARRLEHIERALSLSLGEPGGLMRAGLAVTAWRLLQD
ncbi:MAG TPA: helix-turn-helix domain-containing protein, partial [Egibacteraceae bacterium]